MQHKIPLPDLDTQRRIVAHIEEEQALVEGNKKLIALFEQKIRAAIAAVWTLDKLPLGRRGKPPASLHPRAGLLSPKIRHPVAQSPSHKWPVSKRKQAEAR